MDVLALEGEMDHRDVFLSAHEKAACQRICVCRASWVRSRWIQPGARIK